VRNGKQPAKVEQPEVVYTPQPEPAPAVAPAAGNQYYKVVRGDNVGVIARKNHITVKQLLAWNDIEADKIKAGQKLLVQNPAIAAATKPAKPQPKAEPKVEPVVAEEETTAATTGATQYTVGRGETVSAIARKNHITVKQLLAWNGIEADKIKAGQKLWVQNPAGAANTKPAANPTAKAEPEEAAEPTPTAGGYYTVGRGETVSAIARKNNITVKQLLAWNGIEADKIKAGQKLRVSAAANKLQDEDAPAPKPAPEQKPWKPGAQTPKYYVVKKGETVSAIARKNNITVNQLLKWNDIDPDKIRDGKKLKVSQ
jgi:LysM repeat protein